MATGEQVQIERLKAAGDELATWLDFYANVCKETKDGGHADNARKAIHAWERLVPPKED